MLVKSVRFAAAIALTGASFAMPAGAWAGGSASTPQSQITPTAPSRLTATSTSSTPSTSRKPAVTGSSAAVAGNLPDTGLDLLPETVLGIVLVGVGVGLRLHSSRA